MSALAMRTLAVHAGTRMLRVASRAYVPGETLDDAMRHAQQVARSRITCTLGYFNADTENADAIARQNCAAINRLAQTDPSAYLSVKVPPLGYAGAALHHIAATARQHGQLLHFDSHGPETADLTLAALDAVRTSRARLGLTIPARWQRSLDDVEHAVAHEVRVRVVKGQWACPQQPDADLRERYLAVIDRLAGRSAEVAVATHDVPLAREALTRLRQRGTGCELELLCGLPAQASLRLAREFDVPVRLYIPFGQAWLPYALGQVVRKPRMFAWMLRDTLQALVRPRL